MKVYEVISYLESFAPLSLQESYDNSGLLVGDADADTDNAMICLDLSMEVLDEAVEGGYKLIISHHPLIFGGLKRITGKTETGRIVMRAIREGISIYAMHTNLDNSRAGVNAMLSEKLGVINTQILQPLKDKLLKLVTFCPVGHAEKVREAMFAAGAGHIGNYDSCSYNLDGFGTFRGNESADPFVGEKGKLHEENEFRIEVILPDYLSGRIISEMIKAHPYEEVAYDLYPLKNEYDMAGAGMHGILEHPMDEQDFLQHLKNVLGTGVIRHSPLRGKKISRVALCGGAGSFLIQAALAAKSDVFVTADLKYHQFFEPEGRMLLADAGHYETEQFTKELIYKLLNEKFPTFALRISQSNTNAVHYF